MNNGKSICFSRIDLCLRVVAKTKTRHFRSAAYRKSISWEVVNYEKVYCYDAGTADDLQLAAAVGGEVTLENDIELNAPLNVQANMTLNLGGYTITTTEKETGRHHYAIDNYATLVIEGEGAINARGIQNFGEMTITDGNVTITVVNQKYFAII